MLLKSKIQNLTCQYLHKMERTGTCRQITNKIRGASIKIETLYVIASNILIHSCISFLLPEPGSTDDARNGDIKIQNIFQKNVISTKKETQHFIYMYYEWNVRKVLKFWYKKFKKYTADVEHIERRVLFSIYIYLNRYMFVHDSIYLAR